MSLLVSLSASVAWRAFYIRQLYTSISDNYTSDIDRETHRHAFVNMNVPEVSVRPSRDQSSREILPVSISAASHDISARCMDFLIAPFHHLVSTLSGHVKQVLSLTGVRWRTSHDLKIWGTWNAMDRGVFFVSSFVSFCCSFLLFLPHIYSRRLLLPKWTCQALNACQQHDYLPWNISSFIVTGNEWKKERKKRMALVLQHETANHQQSKERQIQRRTSPHGTWYI